MANEQFLQRLSLAFTRFAAKLGDGSLYHLEHVQPPATDADLKRIEDGLRVPLPEAYKSLLRCGRAFWLMGGVVQFGVEHPFFHNFESLTPAQQGRGGHWPPPSQGMLCFAEFFMEADGDQVLFDVSRGLVEGEYPVLYYAHEAYPPSVRRLADTFERFINGFLDYPAFQQ
jgi:hypothetical protein